MNKILATIHHALRLYRKDQKIRRHMDRSCYPSRSKIGHDTQRLSDQSREQMSKTLKRNQTRENKLTRTLAYGAMAFVFSWLPFAIISWIQSFHSNSSPAIELILSLATWAGWSNSFTTPAIYLANDEV